MVRVNLYVFLTLVDPQNVSVTDEEVASLFVTIATIEEITSLFVTIATIEEVTSLFGKFCHNFGISVLTVRLVYIMM